MNEQIVQYLEENDTKILAKEMSWKEDYIGAEILYMDDVEVSSINSWQIEDDRLQPGADISDLHGLFILENGYAFKTTDLYSATYYKLSDSQLKEFHMLLI